MKESQLLQDAHTAISELLSLIRREAPHLSGRSMGSGLSVGFAEYAKNNINTWLRNPTVREPPELDYFAAQRAADEHGLDYNKFCSAVRAMFKLPCDETKHD